MNDAQNPLLKESVKESLTAIGQGLEYIVRTMPMPNRENDNEVINYTFTRNELLGLQSLIECTQKAVEGCYEQYCTELRQ